MADRSSTSSKIYLYLDTSFLDQLYASGGLAAWDTLLRSGDTIVVTSIIKHEMSRHYLDEEFEQWIEKNTSQIIEPKIDVEDLNKAEPNRRVPYSLAKIKQEIGDASIRFHINKTLDGEPNRRMRLLASDWGLVMTDKTMFTELDQYQWYRDIDELTKHSVINRETRLLSEVPPAPVSLVLTIMEEMASRPEVVAALSGPYIDGKIGDEEFFLLTWFNEYLTHKYGNETRALPDARFYMKRLANGVYSGVDDPKLRAALLAENSIYDDEAGPA